MDENKDNSSLISHLEALRETILKCLISVCLVLPFSFLISESALNYLLKIITGTNKITFNYFCVAEVFILRIKIALIVALVVCFPYIAKKIWDFILPALYENERRFIKSIVFLSTILFVFGVLFCLFFILPLIINFGMSFATPDIHAVFGITNVINLALWLSVAFGLMFQMPLVVHSLIKTGIVEYETIASKRPYVVVGLLVLAAVLTPPDIISQIMLFIPTYVLFEFGLLFSKRRKADDR